MAEHIINKLKQSTSDDIFKLTDYRLTGGSSGQILVAGADDSLTWVTTLTQTPTQASINTSGLITYKNSIGETLFTLQLPLYDGSVT